MTTSQPGPATVSLAHEGDRPTLERLWTMFRHEMSAHSGVLPNNDGRFRQERLDAALSNPEWAGFVLRLGGAPIGLAIVRGTESTERILSSFFLVHGARRAGHGRTAVRAIVSQYPGRWAVAFQDVNFPAAAFWRAIASELDEGWTLDHQDVPGRPGFAPDSWARFRVRDM
ncbi:GNAT family N-acetyltransferase [Cryobacterium sp. TMB1-7]|uniref:GNAT family N-acetyltransferase n=1 Tax=Cryobacterium sp. TMB1-7 TaxID=2555866 RepID=UPI00106A50DD|nr:GNAT family N-acetyltransferase [Cryobacterium sp. TMB1-7]TFC63053.1 GNAT family N-acetyltransferase [Cryobacterium sp. TMB1-7]